MPTVSFAGLASGIDGDAITKALLDARRIANIPLEAKVERNEKESEALEEFNTKLLTLNDTVKDFLTLAGGAISKSANSSNEDAVGAVASSDAGVASTTIDVISLARTATMSFSDRFSAIDEPIAPGLAGTAEIQISIGSGDAQETVAVEIDSTTTLDQLAVKINELAPDQVQASYINAGSESSPEYVLVLQGLQSGVENGTLSVSVPAEITGQGIFQSTTLVQAQDAVIDVSGIGLVTRTSNQISDLIPGLSLELKQENTGPVTISVGTDSDNTAKKIGDLVEAINDIIRYSNENDSVQRVEDENGVTNVYGSLARSRVDDQAIDAIRTALSSARSTIEGSEVAVFADLGVTTERDGTLKFDTQKFTESVGKNPQAVEDIMQSFADGVGTANGVISQYTRYQGTIDQAIKANDQENENVNDRIARLERTLQQQEEMYRKIFANLESTMSRLNSNSEALTGILSGLSAQRR